MGYKGTLSKTNLVLGEISPRAYGRFDTDKPIYKNGAAILQNILVNQDGGGNVFPGTQYVATAGQLAAVRLEPFKYNLLQQYIIEFGNQYMRFYANNGVLENSNTIVQLISPYFQPDIFQLQTANQQDVSYISHPNYPVYKLVRTSATTFTIQPVIFLGGPFLDANVGNVTLTASSATGAGTLTATVPAWSNATQYLPGDYVTNGGNTYLCVQSNFSTGSGGGSLSSTLNTPGTIANSNANGGTLAWSLTNPYSVSGTGTTEYLVFTNFGFALPSSATVVGIVVTFLEVGSATSSGHGPANPQVTDSSIKLVKGGSIGGTDHSAGATWSSGSIGNPGPFSVTYGTNADLWGETLAYSDINASGFGVALAATIITGGNASVSGVSITVYYTTSGGFAIDYAAGYWQQVTGFFQPGHVGSLWSVGAPSSTEPPGTFVVTGFTSTTVVSGYVQINPDGTAGLISTTSATTVWAEGAWSSVRGYPTAVTFHENRLLLGGTSYQPKTIWGSAVGGYENFSPGIASDGEAWNYTSTEGDAIQWLKSMMVNGATGLRVGTLGGCLVWLDGSSAGITPSSPPIVALGVDYQVQDITPQPISSALLYMVGNTYQLRQLVYDFATGADKSDDLTLLADHIMRDGGGAVQIARQESPNDRIWVVRADGTLAIMTRNSDQQVTGWSRRNTGVNSNGGQDFINSIAIQPVAAFDDSIYISVTRTINGTAVQFIEVFTPELFNNYWEPVRVDASLSYDLPLMITGLVAGTATVTIPNHGFTNGQSVKIEGVVGISGINDTIFTVASATTNTFVLNTNGSAASLAGAYQRGGVARVGVTSVSGLTYLNGQLVTVVTDGSLVATYTVSAGAITLNSTAFTVHVGLPYNWTIQLLPLGGDGQTPNEGKKRKTYDVVLRVWKSLGGQFGLDANHLANLNYTAPENKNLNPNDSVLFTGDLHLSYESFESTYVSPVLTGSGSLPFFLLAAIFRSEILEEK